MKGYMTHIVEQHKRMVPGYLVIIVLALIFSVSLKTTSVPAAVTILYISIFASLAPIASLNSDREIDELLSLPGGRRSLVKAQYLNAVFCIAVSILAAVIVTLLTFALTGGAAHLPSLMTMSMVISITLIIIAIMQPLSMIFGRKGLLIGFAMLMFITFQSVIRMLLTNGGAVLFKFMKDYLVGHEIEGISVVISENMTMPDLNSPIAIIIWAVTAVTAFVSSYIIARIIFARKNFQVNKL